MTVRGARDRSIVVAPAIVLRRTDFSETSRIITCLGREHGRVVGLAKGAHRPDSPFLGRLDFLNEVRATFSADRGGLRLLLRVDLLRERRPLREPSRFVAACHLAHLCELALPDERPEPAVHDLLVGGLNLLELCPTAVIPQVVLGLELRHLALLGGLPDLWHCAACGGDLGEATFLADGPGLVCRRHATPPRRAVPAGAIGLLRDLQAAPGRQWPELVPRSPPARAAELPARWLLAATEQRSRLRPLVFANG
jgi:DNA repair protein RecO (recombination protein O)